MKSHDRSRIPAHTARLNIVIGTVVIALACLILGLSAAPALAAPAAPVISGPTAIHYCAHSAGFHSIVTLQPTPAAAEDGVRNVDTIRDVGGAASPVRAVYGTQGVCVTTTSMTRTPTASH